MAATPRDGAKDADAGQPAHASAAARWRRHIRDSPSLEVAASMRYSKPPIRERRFTLLIAVSVLLLMLGLSLGAVSAFAADSTPQPDPSGIALGSGSDLAGIAPGTLTT